jgi:hypothetical protein
MLPESWLLFKINSLQDTRSRHTMAHDAAADRPQVSDIVIPLDKAVTLRRSRTSHGDTQRYHARANKRSVHTSYKRLTQNYNDSNNTATANSE